MATIAVCIPTIRPESFKTWLKSWDYLFCKYSVQLYVMQDAEIPFIEPHFTVGIQYPIRLYTRKDVPVHIPVHTDMVRSFLFYEAWKDGTDYILTLDDDVLPGYGDPIREYLKVFESGAPLSSYLSVGALTDSGLQMRGFPYIDRKPVRVALQYGGWRKTLDYDAATQLASPREYGSFHEVVMPVPKGSAFTGCIMNCMFRTDITPLMWQLPMLDGRYNRVGDIWSGLFAKKALDQRGEVVVINGKAQAIHDRASDVYTSMIKEAPSLWLNDHLWENLRRAISYRQITDEAARFFRTKDPEYADYFLKARDAWLSLFK
jgi:hypothetical protein